MSCIIFVLLALVTLFAFSCCKAAGDADERMEEIMREMFFSEEKSEKRERE